MKITAVIFIYLSILHISYYYRMPNIFARLYFCCTVLLYLFNNDMKKIIDTHLHEHKNKSSYVIPGTRDLSIHPLRFALCTLAEDLVQRYVQCSLAQG